MHFSFSPCFCLICVEFKHHYLCALSHLLQWIPKQVLLSEVPNVSNKSYLLSFTFGVIFNRMSKVIRHCFGFVSLLSVIGL